MASTTQVQTLIDQANDAAGRGDWQATYETLKTAHGLEPQNAGVLSGLGTSLIQLGQAQEALPFFQDAAGLISDSADAYNNLGVAYLLNGQLEAARDAYRQALDLDPDQSQTWMNLAVVLLKLEEWGESVQILAALVQKDPGNVDAMFLLGQCYEMGEDHESARYLYQTALQQQPDHPGARQGLERLPQPAFDPTRIARPEHARKLAALKGLIKKSPGEADPDHFAGSNGNHRNGAKTRKKAVAFYGPPEPATELRLGPVVHALHAEGHDVKVSLAMEEADLERFDTFVFSRPHQSTELVEALKRCARSGKRVVVDLDQDFYSMTPDIPGYDQFGPGNPLSLHYLEECLNQANLLTVPTSLLAERYARFVRKVEVVPNIWDRSNPLWEKPAPRHSTFNVGLLATHVQPRDATLVKDDVARFLREYPQALLVIGASLALYQIFDGVPEDRKLYLPAGRMEDYPFMLASLDVLLVPRQDTPFNQALSERPLLEAGLRRIPWIASPMPAFKEWKDGGMFAERTGEWYEAMKKLVDKEDIRIQFEQGCSGKMEEFSNIAEKLWGNVLGQYIL